MEDITDVNYKHAKRVSKGFQIQKLGEYHDLYVQSNTLLLVDILTTFGICVLKYMGFTLLIFLHQD